MVADEYGHEFLPLATSADFQHGENSCPTSSKVSGGPLSHHSHPHVRHHSNNWCHPTSRGSCYPSDNAKVGKYSLVRLSGVVLLAVSVVVSAMVMSRYISLTTKQRKDPTNQILLLLQNRSWNDYRIGDGINFYYQPNNCSDPSWWWTIVCLYQNRTREHNDIDVLTKVLIEQEKLFDAVSAASLFSTKEDVEQMRQKGLLGNYERPADDQLVVHLRLGDGLCGNFALEKGSCTRPRPAEAGPTRDCWNYPVDCFEFMDYIYTRPKFWYTNIASELKSLLGQMSRVVIVSDARHWTRFPDPRHGNYTVDNLYRQNVASFFRDLGFKSVDFRNAEDEDKTTGILTTPDHDFAYLCAAKAFVQGGGGFSKLAANMVRKHGGIVVEPRRERKI